MKTQTLALGLTALVSMANAFPRMTPEMMARALKLDSEGPLSTADLNSNRERRDMLHQMIEKRESTTFDAAAQYVDVTGDHKFVPPNLAGGDQRGPCPGLNALANHNFLPHNGVADIATLIDAVNKVYSMSLDLGGFLAIYGTVFDGNPLSPDPGYSIGGPTSLVQNILGGGGILGTPSGLSGSHNKYESDVSPTRGDLYVQGDSFRLVLDRFKDYFKVLPPGISSSEQYEGLADFHGQRFDESVNTNPYFFYSPFSGVLVSPAGYAFPVRMMANHSAQFPGGSLDPRTFMSFFAIYGDSDDIDSFEYREGWEQIPANWYKRPESSAYSIPAFLLDVIDHGLKHPRLLSVTANAGKVNTAAVLDLGNITGGIYNTPDLFKPDYLFCFLLQFAKNAIGDAMQPLADFIQNQLYGKTCPELTKVDWAEFEKYPGFSQKYSGYDGSLVQDDSNSKRSNKRQAVEIPEEVSQPLLDTVRVLTDDLDLPNPPNPANGS